MKNATSRMLLGRNSLPVDLTLPLFGLTEAGDVLARIGPSELLVTDAPR